MEVPWNQIQDQSHRPWLDSAVPTILSIRLRNFSPYAITSDAHTNPNQPGPGAEVYSGRASKRCRLNGAAAILVTDASSELHHDYYNFFRLPQLPSDTCFRLRTSFLPTRFLKSFSWGCLFTGVIHYPHHNFWICCEKKYCVLSAVIILSFVLNKVFWGKMTNIIQVVKMGTYNFWQGFVSPWLLWTLPAKLLKTCRLKDQLFPALHQCSSERGYQDPGAH